MSMRKAIGLSLALLFAATTAEAEQADPSHPSSAPSVKAKSGKSDIAARQAKRQRSSQTALARLHAAHRQPRPEEASGSTMPPPAAASPLKAVGPREVGYAAWYGGRHLGHRTSTGERLDAVHTTAAHRSLPLHSLVRVTNLRNGRSVIATINDRGPVSHRFLIDLSPRCAQELDMIKSGVINVSIEPVARPPQDSRS